MFRMDESAEFVMLIQFSLRCCLPFVCRTAREFFALLVSCNACPRLSEALVFSDFQGVQGISWVGWGSGFT